MTVNVLHGNNLDVLPTLADASIDAIVTDPPYELSFMGKKWDASGIAYSQELWAECLRVLKPGGHLLAFGGTRTYHRMVCAIEDAGFEIRDSIHWIYGSGFPKSLNVAKAIDKAAGAEGEVVGERRFGKTSTGQSAGWNANAVAATGRQDVRATATDEAKRWEGWGTALKPAHEPIVVARKPLEGTVVDNVLAHGVGGLNIDATRVGYLDGEVNFDRKQRQQHSDGSVEGAFGAASLIGTEIPTYNPAGRWPANVILDEDAGRELDQQSGSVGAKAPASGPTYSGPSKSGSMEGAFKGLGDTPPTFYGDEGGASRFFYRVSPDQSDIVVARKPLEGTVIENVLTYGTGAMNIDDCRVPRSDGDVSSAGNRTATFGTQETQSGGDGSGGWTQDDGGRWPANVIHDGSDEVLERFPHTEATGSGNVSGHRRGGGDGPSVGLSGTKHAADGYSDSGSAARFFYCAKPSKAERNAGLEHLVEKPAEKFDGGDFQSASTTATSRVAKNFHPTVKPLDLMRYLCRLVTPVGGVILDPFAGSGTTLVAAIQEGFNAIGIEMNDEYLPLIEARIAWAENQPFTLF